jgi:hypothetical protein
MAYNIMGPMGAEVHEFIKSLQWYGLTKQERRTLKGQALKGQLAAARRGLRTILERKSDGIKENTN